MEKLMNFVKENKWFSVTYLIWTFLHLSLFIASDHHPYYYPGFYPFNEQSFINAYDSLELFVYLAVPLLALIIIRLVGEDIKRFFSNK